MMDSGRIAYAMGIFFCLLVAFAGASNLYAPTWGGYFAAVLTVLVGLGGAAAFACWRWHEGNDRRVVSVRADAE